MSCGLLFEIWSTPSRLIIVGRRVDVNKKPFRLSEIPDFSERNPARLYGFEQVERTAATSFDQFGSTCEARIDAIESGQRLRPVVGLNRDDCFVVQTHFGEREEKLCGD